MFMIMGATDILRFIPELIKIYAVTVKSLCYLFQIIQTDLLPFLFHQTGMPLMAPPYHNRPAGSVSDFW